jgi:hypothetical protein
MLHEMLTGKAPFVSAGTGDVLVMHLSAEPPGVRLENPEVPPSVEAAILRGLAKQREHRFQSMADFAAALAGPAAPAQQPPDEVPAWPLRTTAPLTSVTTLSVPVPTTRISGRPAKRSRAVNLVLLITVPLLILIAYRANSSRPPPVPETSASKAPVAAPPAVKVPATRASDENVEPAVPEAPRGPASDERLTRKAERTRARGPRRPPEPGIKGAAAPPASETRPAPRRRPRPWL